MKNKTAIIIGAIVVVLAVCLLVFMRVHKTRLSSDGGRVSAFGGSNQTTGGGMMPGSNSSRRGGGSRQMPGSQSGQSGAVQGANGGGRPNPMAALNLTPDQQKQIEAIRAASRAKREALDANTSLSEADRQAQGQAIRQDSQLQERKILTPDQQKKFDAMRAQFQGGRGGGPGGGPGAGRTVANDPRFAGVNLTSDQQKQIQTIENELRDKMRQIREDTTLSQDDRSTRMHQLFQNQQQEIQALLTPDQQKTYQANLQQFQQRGGGGRHPGGGPGGAPGGTPGGAPR